MFYEFELSHDTTETTKNICCAKDESLIDHRTENKLFKKFRSCCKNLDDQASSDWLKTVDVFGRGPSYRVKCGE